MGVAQNNVSVRRSFGILRWTVETNMFRLSPIGKFDVHISLQWHLGDFCLRMATVVLVLTLLVRARQNICDQAVTSMGFFLTFVHTNAEIQGAYKLSEDFAKPYFHKYWTEIYDVTTIWKRNICSFIVTLSAFDVRPTCDTADAQEIFPFPPNPLRHVLCDVPDCGVDALSQFW